MSAMLFVVALFLPLYPLSVVHNALFMRLRAPVARAVLLLIWPQIGITLLAYAPGGIPQAMVVWAVASAAFYALRLLTVRDLGLWSAMLACSALALTWGLAANGADALELRLFALWFSVPAALLNLVGGQLAKRFGAAYAGLNGGLANTHPRLAGVLVVVLLAAIATPVFPGFFAMLALINGLDWGFDLTLLAIWLTWSWAGTVLLQGFVFGQPRGAASRDLAGGATLVYASSLLLLAVAGLYLTGGGL